MTLQEVADRAGLSLAMVSKIENAQASPSLRTLAQLSQALSVPVPIFFRELTDQEDASLVRAGEGIELARPGFALRLPLRAAGGAARVAAGGSSRTSSTIAPDASRIPCSSTPGRSSSTCSKGALTYRYGSTTYDLDEGDSLLLHGTVQHGPEAFRRHPIRLLSITLTRSDEAIEP